EQDDDPQHENKHASHPSGALSYRGPISQELMKELRPVSLRPVPVQLKNRQLGHMTSIERFGVLPKKAVLAVASV
ncbi:MAG: hypothetical protein WCA96_11825, partial [Methylocella sp.]